jgi:hypothetical protein
MTEAEGRVTLASCNAEEESFEDPDKGHGVFTYFLDQGLRGAADADGDGLITAGELHVYTRRAVTEWARATGHQQTPRVQMNVSGEIVLARDAGRFAASQAKREERNAALQKLRDGLQARIGGGNDQLSPPAAAPLLATLDRLLAGRGGGDDERRRALAEKFVAGALAAPALDAELRALSAPAGDGACDEAGPDGSFGRAADDAKNIKLQLFQPAAQQDGDTFTVMCRPGEEVKLTGLAQSPDGVTRVLLNCRELPSGSLDARDLKIVRSPAPSDMRFNGTVLAGDGPTTAALTIFDAAGKRHTARLHLIPNAAAPTMRQPAIAVIGLSKKPEIDTYEDLRPLRIGMGFTEQLTNVTRDSQRCRLVNGDSDVLKSVVEMNWQQQDAAFDRSQAVRAGKLVGARFVLYGTIYYFALPSENDGELSLKIQLKLVDVETNLLYPASGEASLKTPRRQANGAEFSKKELDQVASSAMKSALNDLWNYLAQKGVLAPPITSPTAPVVPAAFPQSAPLSWRSLRVASLENAAF